MLWNQLQDAESAVSMKFAAASGDDNDASLFHAVLLQSPGHSKL